MEIEKYVPNNMSVSALLGLIASGSIAIPEIQRPFVWKKTQVRDLLDSLYKGYPTGYLIIWKNPDVRLKDGTISAGKKILIDGQQRVTALMTAIAGIPVVNSNYKKERIKIAFDPFQAFSEDRDAEIFAVQDSSHLKSKRWIPDIAVLFESDFDISDFIDTYCADNPSMTRKQLGKIITTLRSIGNRMIGVIDLSEKLDIDTVTDIFIRINSKGSALSQGDFVMSKIAADEKYGGNTLRKTIDYFAHILKTPSFYDIAAEEDAAFAKTECFKKMAWLNPWLKEENAGVYEPDYDDVIRVAFMHKYPRARLSELVSLLSGRDFETREYKEEIIADTFAKLQEGVIDVISDSNFKQFMLAIHGAGFRSKKLVTSLMALDFAYTLYLILLQNHEVSTGETKRLVQKWYVLSVLTGRYSSSPETAFARDIRQIHEKGVVASLLDIEAAKLSDNFWNVAIVQNLSLTSTNNPTYLVYLAAQVMNNDISLLSNNLTVADLIRAGDVHHIFPKEYLKANGFEKALYNQEANYVYLDPQINKTIGKKAPNVYFQEARKQCETGKIVIGSITNMEQLLANLRTNCIPEDVFEMDHADYETFLEKRRLMMAQKIHAYYEAL